MAWRFNPFTGKFDKVSKDNFSYKTIPEGVTVEVPINQEMITHSELIVAGELVLEGGVVVFDTKNLVRIINSAISESINIELFEVIRQTASGITTSLSGVVTGSSIVITNRSGGDNILNITIQGTASPIIKDAESFSLVFNGVDYDFA